MEQAGKSVTQTTSFGDYRASSVWKYSTTFKT
jgi:hypothetical protein